MEELKNVGEDVNIRAEDAEKHQMERRNEVNGWLNSLEVLEKEVNQSWKKVIKKSRRNS